MVSKNLERSQKTTEIDAPHSSDGDGGGGGGGVHSSDDDASCNVSYFILFRYLHLAVCVY